MKEKEFYKKIHPDLYSDSTILKKSKLSKEFFSYFLETLTSQSKEKEFEDYCRKLVEITICPNLLPQTGPTGGGDSKVDSETYPVSEALAESWLFGYNDQAHNERWAFAISAKKDWRSKVKSDVKKIISTNTDFNREYKKIFFLTNQFVSDKKRAELEDDFKSDYNIDVRILDKNWLIENTFKDENQKIAIDAFNMSDEFEETKIEGTLDFQRKKRLREVEEELKNLKEVKDARKVKLSAETVDLARQLELESTRMIGILDRNIRIAKKYGTPLEHATSIYDYCWTMIWWYENREEFHEKYQELENLYLENQNTYPILNLLSTLWITLNAGNFTYLISENRMREHNKLINVGFDRFINDSENPKRSSLARFDYQMVRMQNPEEWDFVVEEYINLLQDMAFNNDIDLKMVKKVLELPVLKDSFKYDLLFELLIEKLGEQSRNIESSQLLLTRGDDFIEKSPYEAIRFYSRALTRLYNEESKTDLVQTFLKLGHAFEQVGLKWGARSYYVKAFVDSFNTYFDKGKALPSLFLSMRALKYLEILLGRVEYSIKFNEFELISENIYPYQLDEEKMYQRYQHYDSILAMGFLKLHDEVIDRYNQFPDYLKDLDLNISSASLKYQLGYYDSDFVEALGNTESVDDFIEKLLRQPAMDDLPSKMNPLTLKSKSKLTSKILGCNVTIETPNESETLELGATILAMFENIFATSVSENMIPIISSFDIELIINEEADFSFNYIQMENKVTINISQKNGILSRENKKEIDDTLMAITTLFISQLIIREEDFQTLKKAIEEENSLFRCVNFSSTLDTFLASEDIFYDFSDKTEGKDIYTKTLENNIDFSLKAAKDENSDSVKPSKVHFGPPPDGIDFSKVGHNAIHVSEVIYAPLWDQAGWLGVSVMSDIDFRYPPIVGLVFNNQQGIKIFQKWINEDKSKKIRIGIITGINKKNPLWYRVIIGDDPDESSSVNPSAKMIFAVINRLHTMEANNKENIEILKESLENNKEFILCPILKTELGLSPNNLREDLFIKMNVNQIELKDVSEIKEEDFFLTNGLMPSDEPVKSSDIETYAEKIIKEKKRFEVNSE